MKLLVILGSGAVGKMTVGQELTKITDFRLYHGHMDIEMLIDIFGKRDKYAKTAGKRIREAIFEEFVKSDQYGLIFTFMLAFDIQADWDYLNSLTDIFRRENADIYYVELVAPQEIRLERNKTENRHRNKASKRNIEFSTSLILKEDAKYRLVSNDGEMSAFENYIKIDNSHLAPDVVAQMVKEKFNL
jgi:hypothetical protein